MKKGILTLVLLLLPVLAVRAQSYSLDWHKIAGGGGASSNSQYLVTGTIGQHDASGLMSGGSYSVIGGFWSLVAVPTPGAPSLKIFLTTTNTAVISWPSPSLGWSLQENSDLSTANWLASAETVNDGGTNKFIIVSPPVGKRFYRLLRP